MTRWTIRPEGSNWGDFGPDDQIGRLNLVTPARRLAGVREVVDGVSFCLSLPLDRPRGRSAPAAGMRHPPRLFARTIASGENLYNRPGEGPSFVHCHDVVCDDAVTLYTQYSTQWDALSHWGQSFDADGDGVAETLFYNGYRAGTDILGPDEGGPFARALGIERLAEAAPQGRAALVDLHRIHGNAPVSVGYDDLMRAFDAQSVTIEPGDFLLIRTGVDDLIMSADHVDHMALAAACPTLDGRDEKLLRWITDSGVVALCSDALGVETMLREDDGADPHASGLPLHTHCLFKLGIHLGELWYLKALADWLGARRRSACLLTAPPLRLPGAVGSPANPVALV